MTLRNIAVLLTVIAIAGCGGGDSDVRLCFGTDDFCGGVFDRNQPPRATAEAPAEAASGSTVVLDGSRSEDPDGEIREFSWIQTEGPPVSLTGAATAVASFVAPDVPGETLLAFRLTVVDDDDAADSDALTVRILPPVRLAAALGWRTLKGLVKPPPLLQPVPATEAPRTFVEPAAGATQTAFAGLWLSLLALGPLQGEDPAELTEALDEARALVGYFEYARDTARSALAKQLVRDGLRDQLQALRIRDGALAARVAGLLERHREATIPRSSDTDGSSLLVRQNADGTDLGVVEVGSKRILERALLEIARADNSTHVDPLALASATVVALRADPGGDPL